VIVDASVAFKWLMPEENDDRAFALIGSAALAAPSLLVAEVANALWKKAHKGEIESAISFEAEFASLATIVTLLDGTPLVGRALAIGRALDHPVYDCLYLALAEAERDQLVTADRRFLNAVQASEWRDLIRPLA
jgi:predicted nucleic acid-binding protein